MLFLIKMAKELFENKQKIQKTQKALNKKETNLWWLFVNLKVL